MSNYPARSESSSDYQMKQPAHRKRLWVLSRRLWWSVLKTSLRVNLGSLNFCLKFSKQSDSRRIKSISGYRFVVEAGSDVLRVLGLDWPARSLMFHLQPGSAGAQMGPSHHYWSAFVVGVFRHTPACGTHFWNLPQGWQRWSIAGTDSDPAVGRMWSTSSIMFGWEVRISGVDQ